METIQITKKCVLNIRKYRDYTRNIQEILIKKFKIIDYEMSLTFDIITSCESNDSRALLHLNV